MKKITCTEIETSCCLPDCAMCVESLLKNPFRNTDTKHHKYFYIAQIYFFNIVENGKRLSYYYMQVTLLGHHIKCKKDKNYSSVALGLSLKISNSYLKDHGHFHIG